MGSRKGQSFLWFLIGVLFGVVIIGLHEGTNKKSEKALAERQIQEELKVEENEDSPVLKQALQNRDIEAEIESLRKILREQKIWIILGLLRPEPKITKSFLTELIFDEDSKKVFSRYGMRDVVIFLADRYEIRDGYVLIRTEDGVKKTAKWLLTGKIE